MATGGSCRPCQPMICFSLLVAADETTSLPLTSDECVSPAVETTKIQKEAGKCASLFLDHI